MANGKLQKQKIFYFPINRKKNYILAFQKCKNYDYSINVSFSKKVSGVGGQALKNERCQRVIILLYVMDVLKTSFVRYGCLKDIFCTL